LLGWDAEFLLKITPEFSPRKTGARTKLKFNLTYPVLECLILAKVQTCFYLRKTVASLNFKIEL
jgi:hypothetical protein